jgi:hypothetical protein
MKFAKLGFSTKEGLSLAHYQDGWSEEYGEGGSYDVELLYKGKKVAEIVEFGNGGPVAIYGLSVVDEKEVGDAILTFLRRTDEAYGPNSKFDFCKNATKSSDLEYAAIVQDLVNHYMRIKEAKSYFKKGYKMVCFVINELGDKVVASPRINKEELYQYVVAKKYVQPESKILYLTETDLTKEL